MWAALLALGAGRWGLGRVGAAGAGAWALATMRQLLRQPLAVPNTGHRAGAHGFAGACHVCMHASCQPLCSRKAADPVLDSSQQGVRLGTSAAQQSGCAAGLTASDKIMVSSREELNSPVLRACIKHRHIQFIQAKDAVVGFN